MAPYATEDLPHPSLSMSGSSYSSSMDSDYEVHLAQVLHLVPRPVLLPERPASPYDQALPTILVSAKYFTGIENYGNYSFTWLWCKIAKGFYHFQIAKHTLCKSAMSFNYQQ